MSRALPELLLSIIQAEGPEREQVLNEHQEILCSHEAVEYIADQISHLSGRVRLLEVGLSVIRAKQEELSQ